MAQATTNILPSHQKVYKALTSGDYQNFALFSCFIDGRPGCAIVAVNRDGEEFDIVPLFVSVTPGMSLSDHDGNILQF